MTLHVMERIYKCCTCWLKHHFSCLGLVAVVQPISQAAVAPQNAHVICSRKVVLLHEVQIRLLLLLGLAVYNLYYLLLPTPKLGVCVWLWDIHPLVSNEVFSGRGVRPIGKGGKTRVSLRIMFLTQLPVRTAPKQRQFPRQWDMRKFPRNSGSPKIKLQRWRVSRFTISPFQV